MKTIAVVICLAFAATSLFAAGPQATKQTAPIQLATHALTLLSSPQPATIGDSPLVRAAKAANRFGKKMPAQVITNETLVRVGGHFTTTTVEAQQLLPSGSKVSGPSFDQLAAEARRNRAEALVAAEQAKAAEQEKRIVASRAEGRIEGDVPELYSPGTDGSIQPMQPPSVSTMGTSTTLVKPKPPS